MGGSTAWSYISGFVRPVRRAWLTTTLTAIVNDHKQSQIQDLLPWNYPANV